MDISTQKPSLLEMNEELTKLSDLGTVERYTAYYSCDDIPTKFPPKLLSFCHILMKSHIHRMLILSTAESLSLFLYYPSAPSNLLTRVHFIEPVYVKPDP